MITSWGCCSTDRPIAFGIPTRRWAGVGCSQVDGPLAFARDRGEFRELCWETSTDVARGD